MRLYTIFITSLLILTTMTGCYSSKKKRFTDYNCKYFHIDKESGSEEISKIAIFCAQELKNKYHFFFEDCRVAYNGVIEEIHLSFSSMQTLELCPARELIVEVTEKFLEKINSNPYLRDKLPNGELTADSLHIWINMENFYGQYIDPLYIGSILLEDGLVYYWAFTAKDSFDKYNWHYRVEPYYKAKVFAENQIKARKVLGDTKTSDLTEVLKDIQKGSFIEATPKYTPSLREREQDGIIPSLEEIENQPLEEEMPLENLPQNINQPPEHIKDWPNTNTPISFSGKMA